MIEGRLILLAILARNLGFATCSSRWNEKCWQAAGFFFWIPFHLLGGEGSGCIVFLAILAWNGISIILIWEGDRGGVGHGSVATASHVSCQDLVYFLE